MKIKINRNILWAETFIEELVSFGVRYACISPGSRSTPLTLAAARNKKLKSYINIDERSSAFFALGLAKAEGTPVVLICTSGTATAEFYPAIIEAYQQRVPLIVCTADRPPELVNVGANQTINQDNIYKNHIRWYCAAGLPRPDAKGIKHIRQCARKAFNNCYVNARGPVHINFPFKKPFEPDSYTDEIQGKLLEDNPAADNSPLLPERTDVKNIRRKKWFNEISGRILDSKKILLIAGPDKYNPGFPAGISRLAEVLNAPVLADGCSNIRFGIHHKGNIISNFDAILRHEKFSAGNRPDLIIHFGRTITSKALETYLEKCRAPKYLINDSGDWFDPSNKALAAVKCRPYNFCDEMSDYLENKIKQRRNTGWFENFKSADKMAGELKIKIIEHSASLNECRVAAEVLNLIPDNSQIMVSNSMPARDFDYFASNSEKNIKVYNNRGASGIDGIISTALGTAAESKKPSVLITGDLAFYYDLNGLLAARNYGIPLIIVLVNNNGGGIFDILPIARYGKLFKEYFTVSHNLDFSHFVRAYGGNYKRRKNWNDFRSSFKNALRSKKFSVIEIRTNSGQSLKLRKKFWSEVSKRLG